MGEEEEEQEGERCKIVSAAGSRRETEKGAVAFPVAGARQGKSWLLAGGSRPST